jgi:hypothetical protein
MYTTLSNILSTVAINEKVLNSFITIKKTHVLLPF